MEKEYIVVLNADVDFSQFNQEMIDNTGSGVIPNRIVDVANTRPGSQRSTHYSLTDEEAEELKNDSRVLDVVIPLKNRDDVKIINNASQTGKFEKFNQHNRYGYLNWGMFRCMQTTNTYGTGSGSTTDTFTYNLDGTGVDVVIVDSGIQVDHPEFNDADGNSRVQQINWYTESGLSGTQSSNHYRDYDGHGTHVAGTTAGLNYGWAKNARIYSVKMAGIEGSGDSGTGISSTDCFDVIKGWHNNKPIDPTTRYPYNKALVTGDIWQKASGSGYSTYDYGLAKTNFHNFGTPTPANPYGGISFGNYGDLGQGQFDTIITTNLKFPTSATYSLGANPPVAYEGRTGAVINKELDGSVKIYWYTVTSGSWIRITPTIYADYTEARADATITDNELVVILPSASAYYEYDGSSWQTYSGAAISYVDTGNNSLVAQRGGTNVSFTPTLPYAVEYIGYEAPTPTSKLGFSEGHKRPTIVNISLGFSANIGPDFTIIPSVDYRGTTYNSSNDPRFNESVAYMTETYGLHGFLRSDGNYYVPIRDTAIDTDIQEMIDAGIHVVIASGNSSFKADISGGVDYNNASVGYYYHRGSSPYNDNAFYVGNIDFAVRSRLNEFNAWETGLEQINNSSVRGPAVDIYAPGTAIWSAISTTNGMEVLSDPYDIDSPGEYYLDTSYKQGHLTGTSMASPQVCGVAATVLELNPHLTPLQLKQKIINMASDDIVWSTSSDNDYDDTRSLLGSDNKFLNTPFNSQYPLTTS
jgi:subtilisin family serine protease